MTTPKFQYQPIFNLGHLGMIFSILLGAGGVLAAYFNGMAELKTQTMAEVTSVRHQVFALDSRVVKLESQMTATSQSLVQDRTERLAFQNDISKVLGELATSIARIEQSIKNLERRVQ